MPTIFTRIIDGELPGRFVWRDERCVAFLSINPLRPGHVLVVPRQEVDHWIDLETGLLDHLMHVSQKIARALQQAFHPEKVGLTFVGLEVPHVHIHVVPIDDVDHLNFANAERDPDPAALDTAADTIRGALRDAGHPETADA